MNFEINPFHNRSSISVQSTLDLNQKGNFVPYLDQIEIASKEVDLCLDPILDTLSECTDVNAFTFNQGKCSGCQQFALQPKECQLCEDLYCHKCHSCAKCHQSQWKKPSKLRMKMMYSNKFNHKCLEDSLCRSVTLEELIDHMNSDCLRIKEYSCPLCSNTEKFTREGVFNHLRFQCQKTKLQCLDCKKVLNQNQTKHQCTIER